MSSRKKTTSVRSGPGKRQNRSASTAKRGSRSRPLFETKSPATLESAGRYPICSEEEVKGSIAKAREAQKGWASRSISQRSEWIGRFRKGIVNRSQELIDAIRSETGKTEMDASIEVFVTCEHLRHLKKIAPRVLGRKRRKSGLLINRSASVEYRPHGVVGIISPRNYPLILSCVPAIQALLAGNGVVIKPSEVTPAVVLVLQKIAVEAGAPDGLFEVVTGEGNTGKALVEADTDMICFTGSTATGRKIGEMCGRLLKPCILELGGKDPMIVFEDADLNRALGSALFGSLSNMGQTCIAIERIYVQETVYEPFVEQLKKKFASLPRDPGGDNQSFGSFTTLQQLKTVRSHVADALKKGASATGGDSRKSKEPGYFFEPVLLTDVTDEMEIMREETFGPVICVQKFRDEEEAVSLAENSQYGLTVSLWTRDRRRAKRVAARLTAGTISLNDLMTHYFIADIPFGGTRASGLGRVNGAEGLLGFSRPTSIVSYRYGPWKEIWWFPFTPFKTNLLKKIINWIYG